MWLPRKPFEKSRRIKVAEAELGRAEPIAQQRIRIDDETDCDLVLQGLYHMLKTPASTLTSVWLSENSRN